MGSDDEWRYIRKGMGRGHEGSDRTMMAQRRADLSACSSVVAASSLDGATLMLNQGHRCKVSEAMLLRPSKSA